MASPELSGPPDDEANISNRKPTPEAATLPPGEDLVADVDAAHFMALGREKWQNRETEQLALHDNEISQAKALYDEGSHELALEHERAAEVALNRAKAAREMLANVEEDRQEVMETKRRLAGTDQSYEAFLRKEVPDSGLNPPI